MRQTAKPGSTFSKEMSSVRANGTLCSMKAPTSKVMPQMLLASNTASNGDRGHSRPACGRDAIPAVCPSLSYDRPLTR
ncbi:hypothetical protein Pta02_45900 [Planobispora takensis]|uniref:Uncharacterized protein n=1 Tax=Planobispora takensis TaxID=1367882 RepID=A0A8J3SY34_9ACTN|nr:hypothetical protein Pta02_45900 [Planobispora takensis]